MRNPGLRVRRKQGVNMKNNAYPRKINPNYITDSAGNGSRPDVAGMPGAALENEMRNSSCAVVNGNGGGKYNIPILSKAMEVLELIAEAPFGLTVQELVNLMNHSKTSIYRIVCSLEEMEYLYKNEVSGRFSMTRKLFKLGLSTLGTTTIMEHAYEPMKRLRDSLKETVVLGTLIDDHIVIMEQISGTHHFSFILKPGTEICLHASAPGKAILANSGNKEKMSVVNRIDYVKYNENTITSATGFIKELAEVEKNGYAVDRGEELSGVHCIGAPVFNQAGKVAAAIWITGPAERIPLDAHNNYCAEVMECANDISYKMGYNPARK